ncbi:MAG: superinfection exclusion B family protein [Gemmatimonadetes bacterium]|nr:superinfection exclusion B family protein [Gemmatimonadota bacterium]
MYESRRHRPIPARHFVRRVLWHFAGASAVIAASLGGGMAGYAFYEGLGWRDAYLNAAMLLGGMGPVEVPQTPGGKLFAGSFALYSGLVFLVAIGIVLAPIVHRVLHTFHWESDGAK